jgi:lipid-A-disaccharide synthase
MPDASSACQQFVGLPNVLWPGASLCRKSYRKKQPRRNLAEALVKLYEDKDNAEAVAESLYRPSPTSYARTHAEKAAAAVVECLS